jgi:hypothetical protein
MKQSKTNPRMSLLENISSGQKKMLINDDSQPTEKRDFKSLTVTF